MRALPILLLSVFLPLVAAGQSSGANRVWSTVVMPQDGFSIEAPDGFSFKKENSFGDRVSARGEFQSQTERFYLFIDRKKDSQQTRVVAAFLRSFNRRTGDVKFAGSSAKSAEFEDSYGYHHRIVILESSDRVYTLHTVSEKKNTSESAKFLNSFILLNSVPDNTYDESLFSGDPVPVPAGGGISGGDTGSGSSSGATGANWLGTGSSAVNPVPLVSPLKIVSKQKAQYTDFARFYNIQGSVTLRVTFLDTAQIGSVVIIKRLPFGLTDMAVTAAKQIRFEPETLNGVARNTSRPVSFTFNIY